MIYHKLQNTSKMLQNVQVLWQYSQVLHLQVNTFFKYWLNTCKFYLNTYKYCHNTCQYWAGEYTPKLMWSLLWNILLSKIEQWLLLDLLLEQVQAFVFYRKILISRRNHYFLEIQMMFILNLYKDWIFT